MLRCVWSHLLFWDNNHTMIVSLTKNIAIDASKPLPRYDNGWAKAYAAIDHSRATNNERIALICHPTYMPRRTSIEFYRGMSNPHTLLLTAAGECLWPLSGDHRFILVYEHNFFNPVREEGKWQGTPWRDSDAVEHFIKPLVGVLSDFKNRAIVHGSIRPSNIFFLEKDKISPVILGDGLSVPPSSTQGVLFEPIERAMAQLLGRGQGSSSDDVYALGVSLAIIMRTIDPMEKMSDEEIIRYKMDQGSLQALAGRDRFSGHIVEVLRGMLHDNPQQRWTVDDLVLWVDGRRLNSQQTTMKKKAMRPLEFAGKQHFYASEIAYSMQKNPVLSMGLIEEGGVPDWLERSVGDLETAKRLEAFLSRDQTRSKSTGNQFALMSGYLSALEPNFPIFYKDKALFPHGAGYMLAAMVKNNEDVTDIVDLLRQNIINNYLAFQENPQGLYGIYIKGIESARLSLTQTGVGFGLERCVYLMCPDSPCLSQKFAKYYVSNIEQMMRAFEDMCEKKVQTTAIFLDRHMIAFLSVFEGSLVDGRLFDLNSKNQHQQILGNLKVLAAMQKRTKVASYPHIAKVISENIDVLCERFHDKELRKTVEGGIAKAASAGSILDILEILDSPVTKDKDKNRFRQAIREYAALEKEQITLTNFLNNADAHGLAQGHKFAAGICWFLALVITAVMLLARVVSIG